MQNEPITPVTVIEQSEPQLKAPTVVHVHNYPSNSAWGAIERLHPFAQIALAVGAGLALPSIAGIALSLVGMVAMVAVVSIVCTTIIAILSERK